MSKFTVQISDNAYLTTEDIVDSLKATIYMIESGQATGEMNNGTVKTKYFTGENKDLETIKYTKEIITEEQEFVCECAEDELDNVFDYDEIKEIKRFGVGEYMLNTEPSDKFDYYIGKYKALNDLWWIIDQDEQELMENKNDK